MTGEIFLTLCVALVVLGPQKLPQLAEHLAILVKKMNQFKLHLQHLWQEEQILQENKKKAEAADKIYQDRIRAATVRERKS